MGSIIGGHLVARALKRAGVECIFTLLGGQVAPIYEGCLRVGIDVIDTRHEQAAAHAADAWARLGRAPGVAVVTAGPGVTEAVSGVANALLAQSPLVVLGGAGAGGRYALPEMEPVPLMRAVTKWAGTVTDPLRLEEQVSAALRYANSGARGPVFLELPFDVVTAAIDEAELPPELPSLPLPPNPGDPRAIEAAGALLAAAERPLLLVGSQVWWDDADAALRALVERFAIPTVMSGMGRGALSGHHAQALNLARRQAFRAADCVVVVGAPLDLRNGGQGSPISPHAKVIQVDRDPAQLGRNRACDVGLVGDARNILDGIERAAAAHGASRARWSDWAASLAAAEASARADLAPWERSDARPINHYRLARAIADVIDEDSIVIGDGGDCVALAARVLAPERPGHWLDPGPLGCLGVGAAFALAAKRMHRNKKVVVLSGDGSFGLNGFDFETCVRFRLPVTVVVANDAGRAGPAARTLPGARGRAAPTRYDLVVEALGGHGYRVDDPADLVRTLRKALASDQVTCVDVPIDPDFVPRAGVTKLNA